MACDKFLVIIILYCEGIEYEATCSNAFEQQNVNKVLNRSLLGYALILNKYPHCFVTILNKFTKPPNI